MKAHYVAVLSLVCPSAGRWPAALQAAAAVHLANTLLQRPSPTSLVDLVYANSAIGNTRREQLLEIVHEPVSYTHPRAHETKAKLACRLLHEKKTHNTTHHILSPPKNPTKHNH